jgi:outer membrane murein-binding lipoprotein Lpp
MKNLKRNLLVLTMIAGVVLSTTGCLVIGNRGGLGDEEKKSLQEIRQQVQETDARLFRLEKDMGITREQPCAEVQELRAENERLRKLLSDNQIPF